MMNMANEIMAVSMILTAILATPISLNYLLAIIGSYKLFRKAGEKGWKAIIPILNEYTRFKLYANNNLFLIFLTATIARDLIVGDSKLLMVVTFVAGIVAFVISFKMHLAMARSHGRNVGVAILLTILPGIGYMILGFDKSEYNKIEA
jgi:hypothetical protein